MSIRLLPALGATLLGVSALQANTGQTSATRSARMDMMGSLRVT